MPRLVQVHSRAMLAANGGDDVDVITGVCYLQRPVYANISHQAITHRKHMDVKLVDSWCKAVADLQATMRWSFAWMRCDEQHERSTPAQLPLQLRYYPSTFPIRRFVLATQGRGWGLAIPPSRLPEAVPDRLDGPPSRCTVVPLLLVHYSHHQICSGIHKAHSSQHPGPIAVTIGEITAAGRG